MQIVTAHNILSRKASHDGSFQLGPMQNEVHFPRPENTITHPWNCSYWGNTPDVIPIKATFSYLDRHGVQTDLFSRKVLPQIVLRKKGKKRYVVFGPAMGEEIATLAAAHIRELGQADFHFTGIDYFFEVVEEGFRRLSSLSPFGIIPDFLVQRHGIINYYQRASEIISTLNRYPHAITDNYEVIIDDATKYEVLLKAFETQADAVFLNVTFYYITDEDSIRVAHALMENCKDAFLFGTFVPEDNDIKQPLLHVRDTHKIEEYKGEFCPFLVGVPKWAESIWK